MDAFHYLEDGAYCEDVQVARIAAEVGTPAYVYSRTMLTSHCVALQEAFAAYPTLACYAVKANSNLSILRAIFGTGLGADLVSLGELRRSRAAGCPAERIVFSGVGKTTDEIAAGLDAGILAFNVESAFELAAIATVARQKGQSARVALRINPDIDARTHPKIATGLYGSKFGMPEAEGVILAEQVRADVNLELVGLACHIGSQITELAPIAAAAYRMADMCRGLMAKGHALQHCDMGGGLGIKYLDEAPPSIAEYARTLIDAVKPTGLRLLIEPGRVLVGNTGVLVVKVLGVKHMPKKSFVVVDGAMNDLIRPSLYEAHHDIVPVVHTRRAALRADIVGPVCETGDYLGLDRDIPEPRTDDLLMVRGAGAYGMAMASQYNSRPRAVEVLVEGGQYTVVRRREQLEDLWRESQSHPVALWSYAARENR